MQAKRLKQQHLKIGYQEWKLQMKYIIQLLNHNKEHIHIKANSNIKKNHSAFEINLILDNFVLDYIFIKKN